MKESEYNNMSDNMVTKMKQTRLEHGSMLAHARAIQILLTKSNVSLEDLQLAKQHAIELRQEIDRVMGRRDVSQ